LTEDLRPRRRPGWEFWLTLALLAVTFYLWGNYPPPPNPSPPVMFWTMLACFVVLPAMLQVTLGGRVIALGNVEWREQLSITLVDPRAYLRREIRAHIPAMMCFLTIPILQGLVVAGMEWKSDVLLIVWFVISLGLSGVSLSLLGLVLRLWFVCTKGRSNPGLAVYAQWIALLAAYLQAPAIVWMAAKMDANEEGIAVICTILTIGVLIWLVLIRGIIIRTAEFYFRFED
jgi:hypothetical protein